MLFIKKLNLNSSIWVLFVLSTGLHGALWFLYDRAEFFNPVSIYVGLVILILNFLLVIFLNARDELIGYILGSSALIVQVLLLILLVKSGQLA